MTVRKTQRVGGFLVVEVDQLPWYAFQVDKARMTILCGELGHVEFGLWMTAAKAVMRRELQATLDEFAHRVGVEYGDFSNTTTNPNEDEVRT